MRDVAEKHNIHRLLMVDEVVKGDIDDRALDYFLPLIQGELNLVMEHGIPKHFAIHESVLK